MNSYEAALRTVCIAFELTENEVCGLCRRERYVEARMWYAWLCSTKLQSVSRRINRDHATVIYYRKKLRDYMSAYPIYQEKARIMKHLYDRVLMESSVPVSIKQFNRQCIEVRDLHSALQNAIRSMSRMAGDILKSDTTIKVFEDGSMIIIERGGRTYLPSEVIALINK